MKIRFYNVRILTMADDFRVTRGEVQIKGNRIAYVGEEKHTREEWDREIDGDGNLIMPGFKDAHTHSAMTFLRSYADDMPLLDWLNKQVFPREAKLTPEDICHLSKLAIMEYLTSGITANFDMYLTPDTIAEASVTCGFRTVITGGMNDFTQSLEEMEEWYCEYNHYHPLISFQLGFHAEYTTSEKLLAGLAELAHKYKAPVYTHNSESLTEVQQCLDRNHMTPTQYLDSLGLFDYGGGGYHCVHMTEEDLRIFKKRGLYAITNPGSNVKLASGIPPVKKMLDMGIPMAIGTDGPASNNCLDMFREMFLTTGLAKIRERDASVVDANQVLYMATVGGARAMGLLECDTLEEGKLADLILVDLHQPNMQPLNCITKNLVYSGSKQNIKLTMVNGRILYEDGCFTIGTEAEEVYKKANEIVARIQ
ncbi:amidohydrolase family protein [Lactonifactor longoviformis]|uniref:5-methylthioadenosine/S-adenosylhomocysteine deaminase n=1 Tax=Lactonifactor longoviformis DSM 17459 TaxID=1122155 RepID=A0A1M4XZU8_9CLOT|nr:amidohydrolase [Lactonifactor longoviformis]SHE98960.1 5-methylthioadenosine/S-adenosylhomocysteine deaminase [Lactonifactor longoviformis DSM 17459]